MKKFWMLLAVVFFPLFVLAQVAPPDPAADPSGYLLLILNAVQGRQWIVLAGLVVIGVVWVVRTYGAKWLPWLSTAKGGATLSLVVGILGSVALVLLGGKGFSWKAIIDGALLAFISSGGFTVVKNLLAKPPAPPTP